MDETGSTLCPQPFPPSRGFQPAFPSDSPQDQDHVHRSKQGELGLEVGSASLQLLSGGPIIGRSTANSSGDVTIGQHQSVPPGSGYRVIGPPIAMQGFVQPFTARIACKDAAGAIATVRSRCKSHDQQPGLRVPKPGHGPGPVLHLCELPFAGTTDLSAVIAKPRATTAARDLVGQGCQGHLWLTHTGHANQEVGAGVDRGCRRPWARSARRW
jgi:hypothetical protein